MLEEVWLGDSRCAILLRANYTGEGIKFFTRDEDSLQLGYMKRETGYLIQPHVHREARRTVDYTHEVLFIRSGQVKVNFFDANEELRDFRILEAGDFILLMESGHGFEILESAEIIEVKQGPYMGEADKKRF